MKHHAPENQAERRQAVEAQRAKEDSKIRLIEACPDCIKVLDLDGRLLSINAGGMKALEICDPTPIIGSFWIDFCRATTARLRGPPSKPPAKVVLAVSLDSSRPPRPAIRNGGM